MSVYHFGNLRPEHLRLGSEVTLAELATALTGSRLTISNNPNGGFVIHRFRAGDKPRAFVSCDVPPGPSAA